MCINRWIDEFPMIFTKVFELCTVSSVTIVFLDELSSWIARMGKLIP